MLPPKIFVIFIFAGGLDVKTQEAALRSSPDVVVATPGRLIDHLHNSPNFTLSTIEVRITTEKRGSEAKIGIYSFFRNIISIMVYHWTDNSLKFEDFLKHLSSNNPSEIVYIFFYNIDFVENHVNEISFGFEDLFEEKNQKCKNFRYWSWTRPIVCWRRRLPTKWRS